MNLPKLIRHDLRCGLLRPRCLLIPILAILPCWLCHKIAVTAGFDCGWGGYLMYCFMGIEPINILDTMEKTQLPILWLLLVSGCLYLNLDYMLNDLSLTGQQIIVRSGNRREWFISKCIWNLLSCGVYFIIVSATAAVFSLFTGGDLSLRCESAALNNLYRGEVDTGTVSSFTILAVSLLLPYLTVSTLSLLQMTLCLVLKPILCFLLSEIVLLVSVYWSSPLILGNGAMGIRSGLLTARGVDPLMVCGECVVIMLLCAGLGTWAFKRSNIIGAKE